ncbi:MAG TPA: hypothetical protein VG963_14190 [Polyangiaceae bacterium]|nr:hypothetical protein [Polyangiaceae bacterium]
MSTELVCCAVPVANNLDEPTANLVVAALGRNGVAADKERDPDNEGRFAVDVGRGDASFALSVMTREELPRQAQPRLSETLGQSSLIPSRADERAKLLVGTAAELEHTLLGVDNVISARVHLALPRNEPLDADGPPQVPTASVLIKHSGQTPPLSPGDISRLVAGAVQGLEPENVAVVLMAVAEPGGRTGTELVRLGPLTTTRNSLPYLRWMIGCVATVNACMVALLCAIWLRTRRKPAAETQPNQN